MALRLSHLFGNSSMFWLNAQNAYALWHAERRHGKELEAVVLLRAAREYLHPLNQQRRPIGRLY